MRTIEKMISLISPGWAARRQTNLLKLQAVSQARKIIRGGNTYTGATNKRSMEDWHTNGNDANSSILDDLPILRERCRDLYNNTPAAHGAISTINTNVIGTGLILRSTPALEVLGLTDEEGQDLSDLIEREFELWANSQLSCDYTRKLNFAEIQRLVSVSQQISGDVFVLMPWVKRNGSIYDVKLQLIEADRICNPNDLPDDKKIAGGIEYDNDGIPIAIHIRTPHPGNELDFDVPTWVRVEYYGAKTGRRNVLHVMEHERIDQARGVPILAPVIETIKQISKYSEAEIAAAVVNAVLAVFIKRPTPSDDMPVDYGDENEKKPWENTEYKLGSGTWIDGAPGEELQVVNAARPSNQFDPFFLATMKQVGMALELPFEILIKHFSSSYSASRAALLEAWKMFRVKRGFIISNFCQPAFEEFLTEAVIKGRINAPGFLSDIAIRAAYCSAQWVGPTPGQLDPGKEYDAANKAVEYGFTSRTRATAELNGQDFENVVKEKAREEALMRHLGVQLNTSTFQPVAQQNDNDNNNEDDNEQ